MSADYKDLEEYGIIGNLETCALVGNDGSIDWLCLPYLESPSVFAALLDSRRGGHFRIEPTAKYASMQYYIQNTNVLQTSMSTGSGKAVITDFMPVSDRQEKEPARTLFRKVEFTQGELQVELSLRPRFDYARTVPDLEAADDGITCRKDDQSLFVQSPVVLDVQNGEARGTFSGREGDTRWFVLQYNRHHAINPRDCEAHLERTKQFWTDWAHSCDRDRCVLGGPWHNLAVRSGLVLKLLGNQETGAIAAAPTTSLPERIGGVRNWDYRYAWIRDSTFTVQALFHLGHLDESQAFRGWISKIARRSKNYADVQVLYGLHWEEDLEESTLNHLSGYKDSAPVRIGNDAARQHQLDVYGELLNGIYDTTRYGEEVTSEDWQIIKSLVSYVCQHWNTEDSGIWEMRGGPRHYVYSKLMCWVAVDRGIKVAKEKGLEAPLAEWRKARKQIRQAILARGFNRQLNSFVQSFDSENLDATSLLIPLLGFLPADDPRVTATIDATIDGLSRGDGLIDRYRTDDGLPGEEGSFVLCSFWLIKALALAGRVQEAEDMFLHILDYVSPLGLLAEEIDPKTGKQLGNFPQAFAHIGLINSALYLGIAKGKEHEGPKPTGVS
jgi:GH15 family glucan-1,4-alpha-glucosidase